MSDENGEIIEGHEYDGIKELNNPLPRWWLTIFVLTTIFAIGYTAYYELLDGPTHMEQFNSEMKDIKDRYAAYTEQQPEQTSEVDVQSLLSDDEAMKIGAAEYAKVCAACHGQNGEGLIGPNLTDRYWIHSDGGIDGILLSIRQGFPDKGMPPWNDIVPKEHHAPLAVYVMSLQGTNPDNPKEPQGELIE